jgi:hypothetical protein
VRIPAAILTLVVLVLFVSDKAAGQTSDSQNEAWSKINVTFDLNAKTRLQVFGGTQNGGDFQWYAGRKTNIS